MTNLGVYFSDVFGVEPTVLEGYGAFNISLVNDMPLFIDPFLLYYSEDETHQQQHEAILEYLRFLRDLAAETVGEPTNGVLQAWYMFPEVKQNWLGYSKAGNNGAGLGPRFAHNLHRNLNLIFSNFGSERVSRASHLERLCLIEDGVGRDNISDFVTNLIKQYLLTYTQNFARQYLKPAQCATTPVRHVRFDYSSRTWRPDTFYLPHYQGDFVILTPTALLTRDDTWINKSDLHRQFSDVLSTIPNEQLRAELNQYWIAQIPNKPRREDHIQARNATIRKYPQILDHFIRVKEDTGEQAQRTSHSQVAEVQQLFITQVSELIEELRKLTEFYRSPSVTLEEARERALFLKDFIENKGGHRFFYANGQPLRRESDLHLLYRLTWFATPSDVTREANDGRGPVDFKISRGAKHKTLVEFKLASNSALTRNLQKQVEVYQRASDAPHALKVIVHFTEGELRKVRSALQALELQNCPDIIIIDAGHRNKPSGSKA